MRYHRLLARLLEGHRENVAFADLVGLVERLGFRELRTSGSHTIFAHPLARELLVLQARGGQAKPYQLRQLLALVRRYNLTVAGEEQP